MEIRIFSIYPLWAGLFFAFYIGFSFFLGVLVYLILTKPSLIRAKFRCLFESVSKKTAMICAVVAMIPFSLYGSWDCWKYYYTLSLRDGELIVKYLFPSREHVITELDSVKVITETEVRKGIVYRKKLVTKENSFTSQHMTHRIFEINSRALAQKIQRGRALGKTGRLKSQ